MTRHDRNLCASWCGAVQSLLFIVPPCAVCCAPCFGFARMEASFTCTRWVSSSLLTAMHPMLLRSRLGLSGLLCIMDLPCLRGSGRPCGGVAISPSAQASCMPHVSMPNLCPYVTQHRIVMCAHISMRRQTCANIPMQAGTHADMQAPDRLYCAYPCNPGAAVPRYVCFQQPQRHGSAATPVVLAGLVICSN